MHNTDKKNIVVSCDVLLENLKLMFPNSDNQLDNSTIENMIQATEGICRTLISMDIHRDSLPSIAADFIISDEDIEILKSGLRSANSLYLLFFASGQNLKLFDKYLKQVDEIAKTAKKLRDLLNSSGPDFANFLDLIDHYEDEVEGAPTANKFLYDAVEMLNDLIYLKTILPETHFGKAGLYKKQGRPRNQALNVWVEMLYLFWVNVLKRSMLRDAKGLSGRKKFLEFLDRCIEPLHPEMMSCNSDALDTALKELQKKIKRGEKPLKI